MAYINLLPWREVQRQRQKKHYIVLLLVAASSGILSMWSGGHILEEMLTQQDNRNTYLQSKIADVDTQIKQIRVLKTKQTTLQQKIRLVDQLQVSRHVTPTIFDHMARLVPMGINFSSMNRTKDVLKIEGYSDSNNHLARFMRELTQSDVFSHEELASIKANSSGAQVRNQFSLKVRIVPSSLTSIPHTNNAITAGED